MHRSGAALELVEAPRSRQTALALAIVTTAALAIAYVAPLRPPGVLGVALVFAAVAVLIARVGLVAQRVRLDPAEPVIQLSRELPWSRGDFESPWTEVTTEERDGAVALVVRGTPLFSVPASDPLAAELVALVAKAREATAQELSINASTALDR